MKRRTLIKSGIALCGAALCNQIPVVSASQGKSKDVWKWSKEGAAWERTANGAKCLICPNGCILKEDEVSRCRTRVVKNGKLMSIAYGNPCAVHVDPIEKKPLMHFLPSTTAYSIATAGCNFACLNCQNWDISQASPLNTRNNDLFPQAVVDECISNKCQSIAYTYAEPTAFYEYMYDTAQIAKSRGIKNVLISNGYMNEVPMRKLAKNIDAANINLKSFSDDTYQRLNKGKLQPVLNTLKILKEENVWIEITNLIVPTWTDNMDMIKRMCEWLVNNGFSEYPLHFLRFFPMYKLTQLPSTPAGVLAKARDTARSIGCRYAYLGNVDIPDATNTFCPHCNKLIIERRGYSITKNDLIGNTCKWCGTVINGRWKTV
jgi:pyruvate formate lyase activating enzyme